MDDRGVGKSRLSISDRPSQSTSSSSRHVTSHSSRHLASRGSSTPEHLPHSLHTGAGSSRVDRTPHAPHHYPTAGVQRQPRNVQESHRPSSRSSSSKPMRYDRDTDDRRLLSPISRRPSPKRPRSSSPVPRPRAAQIQEVSVQGRSGDSEVSESSVRSEEPNSCKVETDQGQPTPHEESKRYQQSAGDAEAALSSVSESASHPRSPPKRRARMLMSRTQWQALSRLWDRTIFPATAEREALAREIGLTPRQVQVWFQNQRQKRRRERETDAANAALIASSSHFSAVRGPEAPHSWSSGHHHYGEDEHHFASEQRQGHPRFPAHHAPNGLDRHTLEDMRMSQSFVDPPPESLRQHWAHHDRRLWHRSHHIGEERDYQGDREPMERERGPDRERHILQEPTRWREEEPVYSPHHYPYAGQPTFPQRDGGWQYPDRSTPPPHRSYPPPRQLRYSARGSRSPHSPWDSNDSDLVAATERTASPRATFPGQAARYRYEHAPRSTSQDDFHRPSPIPLRQRTSSFLPPSLSALAIDRPLERVGGVGRMLPSSVATEESAEKGNGARKPLATPRASHPPPYPHSTSRAQESAALATSQSAHPQDPHRPGADSPPRLPSLSSLLR